jgi:pimeloyl-ACP methyl ester carboxylesterase
VPLVLLTPIGMDAGCWEDMELPEGPVFKHVWPGFGRRPRASPPPSMETLADEVAASYEGPLDVVGMSMGGMVAQHLALRHPDRVRSLLIACTGAAVDRDTMLARATAAERGGMAEVLETTLRRWFTPAALAIRADHPGVAYTVRTLLALDPSSFADGWRAMSGHDVRGRLPGIAAPTSCLAGSADTASPVERTLEVAEGVPSSRFEVLDGPHMMHLENPAELSQALRRHLLWAGA